MSIDDEGADWVLDHISLIRKANLTFTARIFQLLVRHHLSLISIDNILTCDRAVLFATLDVRLEIDFVKLLISKILGRDFNTSTTYPFTCLTFQLCRDVGVPIWHFNTFRTSTRRKLWI